MAYLESNKIDKEWIMTISSRINLSHIPTKTLSSSSKWLGQPIPEIYYFQIFQNAVLKMATGRHLKFVRTGNSAVRSAVLENPTRV